MIKKILWCIVVVIISACASTKNGKDKAPFNLIHSSMQHWAGGVAGSWGTDYRFKMVMETNDEVSFDSVWVDDKRLKMETNKSEFGKKDTVSVKASYHHSRKPHAVKGKETEEEEEKKIKPPKPFEGKAIFRYFINGEENYYVVKEMKTLAPISYP